MQAPYNYGWNPQRTSLTEGEWIAIHTRGSDDDQFPDDEPEDGLDAALPSLYDDAPDDGLLDEECPHKWCIPEDEAQASYCRLCGISGDI